MVFGNTKISAQAYRNKSFAYNTKNNTLGVSSNAKDNNFLFMSGDKGRNFNNTFNFLIQ